MKVADQEWWPGLRRALEQYLEQAARPVKSCLGREGRLLFQAGKHHYFPRNLVDRPREDEKQGRILTPRRACLSVISPDEFRNIYKRLIGLGGKLWGVKVVFGFDPDSRRMGDHSRISFKPALDGRMSVGWTLRAWDDDLKTRLNQSGKGLWDHENMCPGVEFQVVEAGAQLLARLRTIDKALSEGKEQELEEQMPTLCELRWILGSLLDYFQTAKHAHRLNLAMVEYLNFNKGVSPSEPDRAIYESRDVRRMKKETLKLAVKLQRPPTMRELRAEIGWNAVRIHKENKGLKEFKGKLCDAGLAWLPKDWPSRKIVR